MLYTLANSRHVNIPGSMYLPLVLQTEDQIILVRNCVPKSLFITLQIGHICSTLLCKYLLLPVEMKYLQYHIKLHQLFFGHMRVRLPMVCFYGEFPEMKSAENLPMLQANPSSSPSDPAQMVKLFAKLWDQVSWVFLVLQKRKMMFKIDIILASDYCSF